MRPFLAFARDPLIWIAATLLLYAPFAFVEPVIDPPLDVWGNYMDCDWRYVGLVFDPTPDPSNLIALLIVPGAFLSFLAAHLATRGPNPSAHWFMAPAVFVLIALSVFLFFTPLDFFINTSASYRPAVIVRGQQLAFVLAIVASLPIAILALLGALIWRWRHRPAAT